jgi:hypothetical protein
MYIDKGFKSVRAREIQDKVDICSWMHNPERLGAKNPWNPQPYSQNTTNVYGSVDGMMWSPLLKWRATNLKLFPTSQHTSDPGHGVYLWVSRKGANSFPAVSIRSAAIVGAIRTCENASSEEGTHEIPGGV